MDNENKPEVIIGWMEGEGEAKDRHVSFCTLAWDGGKGDIRTYPRDQYDPRLDLGRDRAADGPLPYFDNKSLAAAWMLTHPGEQCQLEQTMATEFVKEVGHQEGEIEV